MSEEMDVRDLESPRYTGGNESGKASLRIQEFPGTEPFVIKADPSWTVGDTELKFARAKGKNPQSVRFTVNGQPLPKHAKIGTLSPDVLQGRTIIEAAPEHGLGAGRTFPAGLPSSILATIDLSQIEATDFERIRIELQDLPYKEGYRKRFKVTVKSPNEGDLLYPCLHVHFRNRWYHFRLILVGYPERISGYFENGVPPCPQHRGKHPHVFGDGTFCWEIERSWEPSMTIAEDFIQFIFKTLHNPREHNGCRVYA